jgi:amidase
MTEIWKKSAGELARAIARRELSSREVIEAHLDRIAAVNPKLNAVVLVMGSEALSAADAADKAVASGAKLGPLHGVPITIKCNIDMKGLPSTWGIPALEHSIVSQDAPLVENLRLAGAIPIGRTNCPDLGMRVHTDSTLYGLTRNPWDFDRTTAGSSGGEAAALASGMSPLGFGNDIGGSLRNPANAGSPQSNHPRAEYPMRPSPLLKTGRWHGNAWRYMARWRGP